jgi:hypothetical protein
VEWLPWNVLRDATGCRVISRSARWKLKAVREREQRSGILLESMVIMLASCTSEFFLSAVSLLWRRI